jgi:ketosteroid isomerase-like protein
MTTKSTEPATNIDIVRQGYDHFNAGDMEWIFDTLAPEVVWEDEAKMPDSRIYRGRKDVERYLRSFFRHWEELRWELEEIHDAGDGRILSYVRFVAKGAVSGAEVNAEIAHLYEMRDLKALRVQTFFDRAAARRAAGLDG